MQFAIFGAGAVGGYFGAVLARAGHEVTFIARGRHLLALQSAGLRVDSISGDFELPVVKATDSPSSAGPVDTLIVAVKTWQLPEAMHQMKPLVGPDTAVVPLLNGVEAPAQLAEAFGADRVVAGLAKIISELAGPGHIRHAGATPSISVGELDNRSSPRTENLRQALADAGIEADIPADIRAALWKKFLFVVSWGGVGAVTRAPVGVLRELPQTRAMLEQSMGEIMAVAAEHSIEIVPETIPASMAFIDSLPPGGTTSLQRDIAAGRRSELEAWNGAVVRLGRGTGAKTPLHDFIFGSLLPLEQKARGDLHF